MITLFIDTSLSKVCIAIVKDSNLLIKHERTFNNNMSKYLMTEIDTVFNNAKLKSSDIDNIVVGVGPGSFTGVRMGITFVKTFAYSQEIPVYQVSTLRCMASSTKSDYIAALIDARRDHVYGAIYNKKLEAVVNDQYISMTEMNELINKYQSISIVTDFEDSNYQEISYDPLKIIAVALDEEPINPHVLAPNYLKETQAERELSEKRNS